MTRDEFNKEINKDLTIIDFYATWCGPCKMLSKEIEKIKDDYNIISIDVDENSELSLDYNINVVPTLIIFKKGKPVATNSGYMNKEELINWINSYK